MRLTHLPIAAAIVSLASVPTLAGSNGHATLVTQSHGPVTHQSRGGATHGPSTTTHGASGTTHGASGTTHGASGKTGTTATSGTTTTTTTGTDSPIADKIHQHPQLESKLQGMLPPNTTLTDAAKGFRNQGQFIAALHVSQNLQVPFDKLKTEMVTNHHSLGQSIQRLKPSANATQESQNATAEAEEDLK